MQSIELRSLTWRPRSSTSLPPPGKTAVLPEHEEACANPLTETGCCTNCRALPRAEQLNRLREILKHEEADTVEYASHNLSILQKLVSQAMAALASGSDLLLTEGANSLVFRAIHASRALTLLRERRHHLNLLREAGLGE